MFLVRRYITGGLLIALIVATILLAPGAISSSVKSVPVRVALVQEQAIQRIVQLTGTVTSARSARLSAATAGLVTALHVDVGSQVSIGDNLLELDSELSQWQWQSAQASAEAAGLALADARRRLQEARTLAPQRSIAETVVRDLAAEVAEDEAALQRAQAEAGYRKGVVARHTLKAPFAGVVSLKGTELGEWVNPGEPILTLVATDQMWIDFPVAEEYLSGVSPATAVTYTLGDNSGEPREGRVATIVPVTDPNARTFLLRVEASVSDPRMVSGMSARAALRLDGGRGLTVSRDAVIKYPDGRIVVWVVENRDDGFVAIEKHVTTGLVFEGLVEILSGLDSGASVVVQGNEALQNGQRVTSLVASER